VRLLRGFALVAVGLTPAAAIAQQTQTDRGAQASNSYVPLAGITELTLTTKLPGNAVPPAISEAEVTELASRRLHEADIALVKSGSGKAPAIVLLIAVVDNLWNCRKPERLPNSDMFTGGQCIGGPTVSITVNKGEAPYPQGAAAAKILWGRAKGAAIAGYPSPDFSERVREYLGELLTEFTKDYRAANPRPD
jgi:hypothetical protein